MMTVDGTDFRIEQPTPFSTRWFSHKFKGPGLRYEVAVSILGGDIVWTNGPFPCGAWPDISIFRSGLIDNLLPQEMVEADRGYRGQPDKIRTPDDYRNSTERDLKKLARSRHETANRRFKQFKILQLTYCHDLQSHKQVFRAIVVLTQLSIKNGEVLFACEFE
jgi:DDE superfamily endonuclease